MEVARMTGGGVPIRQVTSNGAGVCTEPLGLYGHSVTTESPFKDGLLGGVLGTSLLIGS